MGLEQGLLTRGALSGAGKDQLQYLHQGTQWLGPWQVRCGGAEHAAAGGCPLTTDHTLGAGFSWKIKAAHLPGCNRWQLLLILLQMPK